MKTNEEKGLRGNKVQDGRGAMAEVQRAVELPSYRPEWLTARPRPEQCSGKNMSLGPESPALVYWLCQGYFDDHIIHIKNPLGEQLESNRPKMWVLGELSELFKDSVLGKLPTTLTQFCDQ